MPVNLSIKNAPDDVVQRLKERAAKNHRSLNGEVLSILEEAARTQRMLTVDEAIEKIHALRPPRKLSIEEATRRLKQIGIATPDEGTAIIRADRDSR